MKQVKLLLFSFLLLTLSSNYSFGSHVSGGNISYIYTGVPNTYQVTLSLYRDCSGINAPSQGGSADPFVTFDNNCGHPSQLVEFPNLLQQEISALDTTYCPDGSTCVGGALPGMQLLQYQATVTLLPCDSWTVSYSLAARNPSVNTQGGNFYVETVMNTATNNTNTSPSIQWTATNGFDPIPYGCVGSLKTYAPNVVEPDGDSLVFSLVGALGGPGAPINYIAPFNGATPVNGINIDPNTGLLTFTANMAGNYVITILIEEFDQNGNLLGSQLHDFQFVAEICTNNAPVAPNNIVNYNGFSTNAVYDSVANTISLCQGDQFCFDVTFTDPDGDSIALFSNVTDILPNSTFSYVYVSPDTVIGTVCWGYQQGYTGSIINITANELICIPGSSTFSIGLNIPPPLNVSFDDSICGIQTADLSATGQGPLTWSVISGDPIVIGTNFSCQNCNTPVATPSITTTYVVADNSSCSLTDTINVKVADNWGGLSVEIFTPDDSVCLWDCLQVEAMTEEEFPGANYYPWSVTPVGMNGVVNPNSTVDVGLPTASIGTLTNIIQESIDEVCVDISHPNTSELKLELEAPNGSTVLLSDGNGGAVQNGYSNTCFRASVATGILPNIVGALAPFVGPHKPEGNLDNACIGSSVGGVWKLKVTNSGISGQATVHNWSIKFKDPYVNYYQSSFFGWDNSDGMPAVDTIDPLVCPLVGGQYILSAYTVDYCFVNDTININLYPQPNAGNDTTVQVCIETGVIDLFTYLGGTPDNVGTWQGPNGAPVNPIINSNAVLDSVPYLYIAESPNGCLDSAYLIVDIVEVTIDDTTLVMATCKDFSDGEITVFATNALSYSINGLPAQGTNVFTGLSAGSYDITAYNQPNGQFCIATIANVVITEPDLLKITDFNVNLIPTANPDQTTTIPTEISTCQGKSVPLSGTAEGGNENGFYQFEWYMNNSFVGLGQDWTTPNNTEGNGFVILNDGFCPADTAFFDLNYYEEITPDFIANPESGCVGENGLEVVFTDASILANPSNNWFNFATLSFSDGDARIINSGSTAKHIFTEPGFYDVTMEITSSNQTTQNTNNLEIKNLHSCRYEATKFGFIEVFPAPKIAFVSNPAQVTVYEPTSTMQNLSPTGGSNDASIWDWSFGSKAEPSTSIERNPSVTYPDGLPGKYPVTLTGTNSKGCSSTINGEVQIINDVNIFAPNIFTPDGNSFNDTWKVHISGIDIYDFELTIFNRYGEIVFQSFDPEGTWDGTYGNNGNLVQDGTYPWIVRAKDAIDDNKYEFKGAINIVR